MLFLPWYFVRVYIRGIHEAAVAVAAASITYCASLKVSPDLGGSRPTKCVIAKLLLLLLLPSPLLSLLHTAAVRVAVVDKWCQAFIPAKSSVLLSRCLRVVNLNGRVRQYASCSNATANATTSYLWYHAIRFIPTDAPPKLPQYAYHTHDSSSQYRRMPYKI